MKRMFRLLGLVSVFFALQATAQASYLSCSNGDIEDVGDAYFQIDVLEDGLEFFPYESSFTIDAAEIAFESDTFAIVNKTVTVSSEGQEFPSLINALLILDEKNNRLNAAISFDKGPFRAYEMTCVKK